IQTIEGFFEDCLIMADDFAQYWLGAYSRQSLGGVQAAAGIAEPIDGFAGDFGGPVATGDNPLDEAGVFEPTSDVLPPSQFPQFASHAAAAYVGAGGENPFAPVEGDTYAAAVHADQSYMRLSRTLDLEDATSAELRFQISHVLEPGYDFVIVEAHRPGVDDWVTLPEVGGATTSSPPNECVAGGFLL